jgi:hypothetical protein
MSWSWLESHGSKALRIPIHGLILATHHEWGGERVSGVRLCRERRCRIQKCRGWPAPPPAIHLGARAIAEKSVKTAQVWLLDCLLHRRETFNARSARLPGETSLMKPPSTTSSAILTPVGRSESAYRGPCRVLGAHITRITRGGEALILCGEYGETGGICLLRQAALECGSVQELGEASPAGGAPGGSRCVMLTA